jgi:DNA-binding response OmpR family regulator
MAKCNVLDERPAVPAARPGERPPPARILMVGGCGQARAASLLCPHGYDVAYLHTLRSPPEGRWDLVILSPRDGDDEATLQLCRSIRARCAAIALFVLAAGPDPAFALRAFRAGADDCLSAPQNPREVLARVRALLRRRERSRRGGRPLMLADGVRFDPERQRVDGAGERAVELTQGQSRLLVALLGRRGQIVSREVLIEEVLGQGSDAFDRAIDVHVSRLRRRLATVGATELITTYRGVGYRCAALSPMESSL